MQSWLSIRKVARYIGICVDYCAALVGGPTKRGRCTDYVPKLL